MLRNKAFVRKTKRGTVVKVVKEHYLRDDLSCGWAHCEQCSNKDHTLTSPRMVPEISNMPHYLVPDTNVLYHQIDVMEHKVFTDVIILQTVLDELRHRSMAVYNRVRALVSDRTRRLFVFCNEHHRDTYVERTLDETPNDRNDRAIRTAVEWYNAHMQGDAVAVLLTDDAANRNKAISQGLISFSVRQYVHFLKDAPELIDMVASVDEDNIDQEDKFMYPEHLSANQISSGLRSGAFIQGKLTISPSNFLEGSIFAEVDKEERSVLIIGREHLNRGIDGDVVAVQLLPRSEWKAPAEVIIEEEEVERADGEADATDDLSEAILANTPSQGALPTGKIVGIIKRNWRPYCGTIEQSSMKTGSSLSSQRSVFFWAMDRKIPKIRIRTRQAETLVGKRIIVAIDGWARNSKYPFGHYVRTLGEVGDRVTETEVVLLEHDVPFAPFSANVLSFLPPEGEEWVVRDEHLHGREDFRGLDICSIDPPGCTDIDDALHCRPLPNGNYEVGVHIADVSHFVKPDNAMDLEARRRGTTVYLVNKRIDMLPGLLGTNLCSLRSNVDRLAFSTIWEMTAEAEVVSVRYTKSAIRSKASLTYDEAQARLDDPTLQDPVTIGIKALNALAKKLRGRRIQAGALTLASPEVRFKLEDDQQDPVDVEMKELKETNALVEEFMLLANIWVADKIHKAFPETSMLRRHPKPPQSNFETLIKAVSELGITLDVSTSRALADSLDKAVSADDAYVNKLIRIMTTRCMMQAQYFCSGTVPETDFWHYGLATRIYTHFTSPIRRYADLIVHRLLAVAIGYDKSYKSELVNKTSLKELSDGKLLLSLAGWVASRLLVLRPVLNYRHRMAQQASRSSVELFTNLFFKDKVVKEEGYVIRVMKNGFSLLIPKYGIEGYVYATPDTKGAESPFTYDGERNRLISDETVIQLFDKVTVQISVEEAGGAARRSKLTMKLVEPRVAGLSIGTENVASDPMDVDGAASARPAKKARKDGR
ncbi:hypothetical protein BC832DRAFT_561272 [Gaertneriomyces semiglobifer]|nr:hypothetical protein BC832DRAFT_561272 [Gaertneriomyces semiglobifer]